MPNNKLKIFDIFYDIQDKGEFIGSPTIYTPYMAGL